MEPVQAFEPRELTVTFVAGAVGYDGGETPGFDLVVWEGGAWQTVASEPTGAPTSLATLTWTNESSGVFDDERFRELVFGPENQVNIGIWPRVANGPDDGTGRYGQVSADYAEIKVRYRLP